MNERGERAYTAAAVAGIGKGVNAGGGRLGRAVFQVTRVYRRGWESTQFCGCPCRRPACTAAWAAGGLVALEEVARAERARNFLCGETAIRYVWFAASGSDVLLIGAAGLAGRPCAVRRVRQRQGRDGGVEIGPTHATHATRFARTKGRVVVQRERCGLRGCYGRGGRVKVGRRLKHGLRSGDGCWSASDAGEVGRHADFDQPRAGDCRRFGAADRAGDLGTPTSPNSRSRDALDEWGGVIVLGVIGVLDGANNECEEEEHGGKKLQWNSPQPFT